MQSKSCPIFPFLFAGEFSVQGIPFFTHIFIYSTPPYSLFRLVVTDNAQCGAFNTWASANKKSRNAKISHQQNPALSDAVLFFLHVLETDTYIHFDFKRSLYSHFQQLLQVPGKALLLDGSDFAAKANQSQKYPPCTIDTSNPFDEDGDPIFVAQSEPASPMPAAGRKSSKKPNTGAQTSSGLKRKLGTAKSKPRN